MSTVGMDKYVLNIDSISEKQIMDKVNELVNDRNNIKKLLTKKNQIIQREILTAIKDRIGDK